MREVFKNAWHNVRGISSAEMVQAAKDAQRLYGDIIDLPHPVSAKHPPLSMEQKAAQFSPFAALTGYEDAIEETGRLTQEKLILDEDRKAQLDAQLRRIADMGRGGAQPQVSITYFLPDLLKEGGRYVTVTGTVRKIDHVTGRIILQDGPEIPIEDLFDAAILQIGDGPVFP